MIASYYIKYYNTIGYVYINALRRSVYMLDIIFENPFYIKHREFVLCMVDLFIVVVSFFLAYLYKIYFLIYYVGQIYINKVKISRFFILILYFYYHQFFRYFQRINNAISYNISGKFIIGLCKRKV